MAEQAKLAVEWVKVDSIHIDPANVRRHPERNLDTIKASLARFGQQKPIVVDADGIVRAGNGTLEAARALNWGNVAIVRTPLKGSEATAYAIADNRSSELAEWDETGLAEQLRALQSEEFDLDAVGHSGDEVDALIEKLAGEIVTDPAGEWGGMPEFEHEDLTSQFRAIVHFANEEDMRDFERLVGQDIPANTKSIWYPKAERQTVKGTGYVTNGP
jgi:ParB-like chromosome segregation protein Spo0J